MSADLSVRATEILGNRMANNPKDLRNEDGYPGDAPADIGRHGQGLEARWTRRETAKLPIPSLTLPEWLSCALYKIFH